MEYFKVWCQTAEQLTDVLECLDAHGVRWVTGEKATSKIQTLSRELPFGLELGYYQLRMRHIDCNDIITYNRTHSEWSDKTHLNVPELTVPQVLSMYGNNFEASSVLDSFVDYFA